MIEVAFDFDSNAILLGYPRYAEHTERLHRHHWNVKISSLPAAVTVTGVLFSDVVESRHKRSFIPPLSESKCANFRAQNSRDTCGRVLGSTGSGLVTDELVGRVKFNVLLESMAI